MGADNSKGTDPKQINLGPKNNVDVEFQNYLQAEFRKKSNNGRLNKDKFNEALQCLEFHGYKRIRNTPLGDRLFTIFTNNASEYIDEETFIKGLTEITSDEQMRFNYSFKVFCKGGNNKITRKDFQDFFKESWQVAFRMLGETMAQQYQGVSLSKVNTWAKNNISQLVKYVDREFDQIAENNVISFTKFKQWIQNTEIHSVEAQFDNNSYLVPVNLYKLKM